MFKKTLKKALALSLAVAMAFSGAQIAGVGGADKALAVGVTTNVTLVAGGDEENVTVNVAGTGVADESLTKDATVASSVTAVLGGVDKTSDFTIVNPVVTATGTSTGSIKAKASAAAGNYVLKFADNPGSGSSQNINVTVTASVAPTIQPVNFGGSVTEVIEGAAANMAVTSITAYGDLADGTTTSGTICTGKFTTSILNNTVEIAPILGKTVPGTYQVSLANPSKSIFIKVNPLSADTAIDLGFGETANLFFAGQTIGGSTAADDTDKALEAGKNLNVFAAPGTGSATDGTDVIKVALTGASAVGGTQAVDIVGVGVGESIAKKIATVTVTTKDKKEIKGVDSTLTVVKGETAKILPQEAAPGTDPDYTKFSVVKPNGDTVDNPEFTVVAKNAGFVTTNADSAVANPTVTGVTEGPVVITLKNAASGAEQDITVTVIAPPSITVKDKDGETLAEGAVVSLDTVKNTTHQLTAITPEGTTAKFESTDTSKVEVSETGLLTAKAETASNVTIKITTAATKDVKALSKTIKVKVYKLPFNEMEVKDPSGETVASHPELGTAKDNLKTVKLDLLTNKEAQMTTTLGTSGGQLTYTYVGNKFNVDQYTGKITVKDNTVTSAGPETVTVGVTATATSQETSCTFQVSVTEKPEDEIKTKASSIKVVANTTYDLEASSKAGAKLTFAAVNENDDMAWSGAVVDANGVVTGKTASTNGRIKITAAATDTTIKTVKYVAVEVKAKGDNTITIKNKATGETIGDNFNIKEPTDILVSAEDGATLNMIASTNPEIVSISEGEGYFTLTPNSKGTTIIAVKYNPSTKYDETTRYLVVNYDVEAATITADKSVATTVGKTVKISASASDGSALSFTSDDPTVATVSDDGTVTGVGAGKTVVIIKTDDGALAACVVTVNKAANTIKVVAKKATVSAKVLAKKNKKLARSKVLSVSKAKGTVTYTKKSGNAKITIAKKTGKVTVKKGLKKGTYKVKVAVKAAGNANYKAKTVTKTFKIVVK